MEQLLLLALIILVLIIITFIIIWFLFKKYKSQPVSTVVTKVRARKVYDFRGLVVNTSFSPFATFPVPVIILEPEESIPPKSTITTGINGANKTLNIYNMNSDSFKIIGVSLDVTPKDSTVTSKIGKTIGAIGSSTLETYNEDTIDLPADTQIQFNNLNDYIINRLTITCDNAVGKSLYIYFHYIDSYLGDIYSAIRVDNLVDDIFIVNFFWPFY